MNQSLITVVVPSFNQGKFLDKALTSIFEQGIEIEVFVVDGGSTDGSIDVIKKWEHRLTGWRSHSDSGQSSAINEGVALGTAPYLCWLNSDDWFEKNGLKAMLNTMQENPTATVVYAKAWNYYENSKKKRPVWVEAFNVDRLALRCFISQPASLIRRSAWEAVGGLDSNLHMVMDYDLWWRLYRLNGAFFFLDEFVAFNRIHDATKTKTLRRLHYKEAMQIVKKHYGCVPLKWWVAQPYAVWLKSLF